MKYIFFHFEIHRNSDLLVSIDGRDIVLQIYHLQTPLDDRLDIR